MKRIVLFSVLILFGFIIYAQDSVKIEKVKADTVKVEAVKTDSAYIQPINNQSAAQTEKTKQPAQKKKNAIDKMYFGGYANLSFGSYTVVGIEPLVGYKLTPRLSVGGKISYEYISDKRYDEDYSASNYGFSLFSRLRLTQRLYAHAEYSEMNYKLFDNLGNSNREWVPFLLLGGGYSLPVTKNTWFTAEVLFDVLQNENSPYRDWEPFFSVGFGVGF